MSEELGEKPVTGTQSIDRACDLLIRVINSEDPQTLSELVAATGLAKGTTSRLLRGRNRSPRPLLGGRGRRPYRWPAS